MVALVRDLCHDHNLQLSEMQLHVLYYCMAKTLLHGLIQLREDFYRLGWLWNPF